MTTPDARAALGFAALRRAALRSARGKRKSPSVARYLLELEPRLLALEAHLLAGTWQPARPVLLSIRDPKRRTISVAPFEDRVVHQALAAVVGPRIERGLVSTSFACRVGAGTHAALRTARAWSRSTRYWVRLDVRRYFPTIDHALLDARLVGWCPEPWLLDLSRRIVSAGECERQRWHFPGDDLFTPLERGVGLPLGNLTSQLWANGFLGPLDRFVKQALGVRCYLRYMDDMVLFGQERREVEGWAHAIEERCLAMRLRLHRWSVQETRAGVGIVGYRVMPDHVRVRRTTVARGERATRLLLARHARGEVDAARVWASLRARFAHWDWAASWRLEERFLRDLGLFQPWP